ncbi:MAG: alpha/beta hydrolase [Flavobacteriaceae bacterium]|jgi:pimeloyl-ACP methyl ester carboxylesterase|nr:alpha/beta hydrolase [Flavobacteriaceae bacterium]
MAIQKKAARPQKTKAKARTTRKTYLLQEAEIDVEIKGMGLPLLLLHSEDRYERGSGFVEELAKKHRLIMPWMPGFGNSTLPESVTSIEDISYLYLDLLDQMKLTGVSVLGFSVGGWIAAEMATKDCHRLKKLALVTPVGIKNGGPYDRDIEDIYYHPFATVKKMKFHDIKKDPRVLTEMTDTQALNEAKARETIAKLCWDPYFHNPSLRYRLNRVQVKTLLIWGANDGIVKPAYGRGYARKIPGAQFVNIPKAGHFPHVEQPDAFMEHLRPFLR